MQWKSMETFIFITFSMFPLNILAYLKMLSVTNNSVLLHFTTENVAHISIHRREDTGNPLTSNNSSWGMDFTNVHTLYSRISITHRHEIFTSPGEVRTDCGTLTPGVPGRPRASLWSALLYFSTPPTTEYRQQPTAVAMTTGTADMLWGEQPVNLQRCFCVCTTC